MEQRRQPSIETRGDVIVALMRIDEQLHRNRNRGLLDWPFKPLSRALRALVARLETEDAGKPVTWPDGVDPALDALKRALRERTPVAYFAYGAINNSGAFHSGQHGKDKRRPNHPGWFYFEAEHCQWAGPFPTEAEARANCADIGDE
ncbi:MAG: hypothetical protein F4139_00685 [Gemmatimonadetes bacterium]|nr:hypothetical protein [Gemmatimonadota bacterium]MYB99508.1 hypothetical protein [Gemmatimonadota bacterium]MYH51444.1 hypothetical protein [Gemmatimonadota bacterium]MYK65287.1 hypothetical protein [Gemmatimonadota bacterium]